MILFKILKGISFTIKLHPVNWVSRKLVKKIVVRMYKPYVKANAHRLISIYDMPYFTDRNMKSRGLGITEQYINEVNKYLPNRHHVTCNQFVMEFHFRYADKISDNPVLTLRKFHKDELRRCNEIIVAEANRKIK